METSSHTRVRTSRVNLNSDGGLIGGAVSVRPIFPLESTVMWSLHLVKRSYNFRFNLFLEGKKSRCQQDRQEGFS